MRSNLEHSNLFDTVFRNGRFGSARKILSANVTLADYSDAMQFFDPNGGAITVTLPAFRVGKVFYVFNVGSSGTLTVKNALAVTVASLAAGKGGLFVSSAAEWGYIADGQSGLAAPNIREVTAAGAITFDVSSDDIVIVNKTVGAATTVNLPALAGRTTSRYIKISDGKGDAATNNITITPFGAETILGLSSYVISNNYGSVTLWARPSGGIWYA